MMSVPVINSVLPQSGNQPAKINSSQTASPSVSPLGIAVPPKLSVIPPPQISTSPSKPSLGVNHSQVPLSLVYENKVVGTQGQSTITKPTADKPKDLSPSKPTSNGVEATNVKTPPNTQQPQPTATTTTTSSSTVSATSSTVTTTTTTTTVTPSSKTEETTVQKSTNHSEEKSPSKNESATAGEESATPASGSQTQKAEPTPEKVQLSQSEEASKQKGGGSGESQSESAKEEAKEEKKETGEKEKSESSNEKTEEKQATTGQTNKRKREQKQEEKKEEEPEPEKKTRRIRSQVLPYQSPLPELATFINKSLKEKDAAQKSNEEKLIVFYKNEFLAVRNAEGGFYLCQTLQNVYRTSHRIRIRWLSQKKEGSGDEGDIYAPDFYDLTDFECILTTVALSKMEKNMYKLRKVELERIENILKRALDVEKGVTEKPSITEEHPDGIDLSLYKDESQLQKPKKAPKRKASSPESKSPKQAKKTGGGTGAAGETPAKSTQSTTTRATSKKKSKAGKKVTKTASKKVKGKKGKSESSKTKAVDQLKVSPPNEKARVVAKVLRKVDIVPVKEVTTKKTKSKATKRSPPVTKSQRKKGQRGGKKGGGGGGGGGQETGKEEPAQSHHERRQGKSKYSNNKTKKN